MPNCDDCCHNGDNGEHCVGCSATSPKIKINEHVYEEYIQSLPMCSCGKDKVTVPSTMVCYQCWMKYEISPAFQEDEVDGSLWE